MSDETRLGIMKKAAAAAPEAGNVAIATRDLRWLIELAERGNRELGNVAETRVWNSQEDE